ncbi:hypothetical protein R3W88_026752 [Solanum pinnatisectum]|uniref:Uncharacterized protein n=1 Tax=Solanum pinnatisectum TaxID=50273 RepID=A0AAV9LFE9_9SOLN|nr:hypothetical protein R3W88_026752 [Solanum pinnatisectum]
MSQLPSLPRNVLGTPNEIDSIDFYLSPELLSQMKSSTSLLVEANETSCPTSLSHINLNNPAPHCQPVSLENTEPIFDRTPEVGLPPPSDSDDTDEDNTPLRWVVQKRMVPVIMKGKEKAVEETPRRKPFTRATNKKFMGDAMKSNITTTEENRRRRKACNLKIDILGEGLVVVQNEQSENDIESEDIPLAKIQRQREEQEKEKGKGKFGKSSDLFVQGRKRNGKEDTKQDIVNNMHVQKVLGGRVFDPLILKKPGMNSLADLVEIQSWTHLFMTKSPIMHED